MAEFRDIPLALIDPPEFQFGFDERYLDLDDLAADVKKNGFYVPLIVEPKAERFRLVDGMRRWNVARRLSLETVPCKVQGPGDPPAQEVQLKTTLLRENQNHAEMAVLLYQLAEKCGGELEPLLKATGQSESWINDHLQLIAGDKDVLRALGENQINYSQAKELNKCKNDALRLEGLRFAIYDNVPALKLRTWIKQNDGVVHGTAGVPEGASPAPVEVVNGDGGIRCAFCGGDRDPQNMVNLWIHRWELEIVQKVLQGGPANA